MELREIGLQPAKPALDLANIVFHAIELPARRTQMFPVIFSFRRD
jgi:hypothetical protein